MTNWWATHATNLKQDYRDKEIDMQNTELELEVEIMEEMIMPGIMLSD